MVRSSWRLLRLRCQCRERGVLLHTPQGEIVRPRNATEQLVSRIMRNCLECDNSGALRVSLILRRHSLAALRPMTRLEKTINTERKGADLGNRT